MPGGFMDFTRGISGGSISTYPLPYDAAKPILPSATGTSSPVSTDWAEVDSTVPVEPGKLYRATMRVKRRWQAWYSDAIRTGVRTYDLLTERVEIKSVAFNFHTEMSNPDYFDVIVEFKTMTGQPKEAGLNPVKLAGLIAGALFLVTLATGTLIKFEAATGAVSTTVKSLLSPGTILLAVVALFLFLKLGRR